MASYPENMVAPMRHDLTEAGFAHLKTAQDVDNALENTQGTTLLVVNSVCGCAAANARPGVKMALQATAKLPTQLVTVFAGMETDAVNQARSYLLPYPPSSPAIALLKNGEVVHILERHMIEGRPAQMIADNLIDAMQEHC
jgi:putative YphP/YqiW family bacilliredoxin